jgi:Protein of unknown function (DUF4011)
MINKMPATTEDLLNSSRRELLDLSTRNRLLSIPVNSSSARIISVRDEISEQTHRLLTTEKKAFSFLPGRSSAAILSPAKSGRTEDINLFEAPVLDQPGTESRDEEIDAATR